MHRPHIVATLDGFDVVEGPVVLSHHVSMYSARIALSALKPSSVSSYDVLITDDEGAYIIAGRGE